MNLDPDPLSSDSSGIIVIRLESKGKEAHEEEKRRKNQKDDSSDPSSRDDYDSSDDSNFRR